MAKVAKRIEQVEASIARYLAALDRADREDDDVAEAKTVRLKEKIEGLRRQMQSLKEMGKQVEAAPDKQVSLTDPDARSMATSGKGTGIVGYNVQIAVDAEHHLIVAHEVTNIGSDRAQLTSMAQKAQEATGCEEITVLADRGYYNGDEVLACEGTGVLPCIPKTQTSGNAKRGLFTVADFIYDAENDRYTGWRDAQSGCDFLASVALAAETLDLGDDSQRRRPMQPMGPRAAIAQSAQALTAISGNPFANGPWADACGFADSLRRLPAFNLPYNSLSTVRGQTGILVHVHPVLPWNLKSQQPQLPRSEPDGQPTESSHLVRTLGAFPSERRSTSEGPRLPYQSTPILY